MSDVLTFTSVERGKVPPRLWGLLYDRACDLLSGLSRYGVAQDLDIKALHGIIQQINERVMNHES